MMLPACFGSSIAMVVAAQSRKRCGHRCFPKAAFVCFLIRFGIEPGSNAVATSETHRALQAAGLWRSPRVSNIGR